MESRIGASVQVEPFTITRRKVPEVADPGHATNMTPSVDWKRFCERKDFNFLHLPHCKMQQCLKLVEHFNAKLMQLSIAQNVMKGQPCESRKSLVHRKFMYRLF